MKVSRRVTRAAFTLLEITLIIAIVGTLAALAVPGYIGYVEKARVASAISDIKNISIKLDLIAVDDREPLPDTLAAIDLGGMLDPWGNPYQYLRLDGAGPGGGGGGGGGSPAQPRKDRFLVPINSDYDLYSKGADGDSVAPLTAAKSHDDVIRAADGSFIGLAVNF